MVRTYYDRAVLGNISYWKSIGIAGWETVSDAVGRTDSAASKACFFGTGV